MPLASTSARPPGRWARFWGGLVLIVLLALGGVGAGPAFAQGVGPQKGREVYERGVEAMQRGDLDVAIGLFEVAHAQGGFKNALWNLAECYRQQNRPARAAQMLEQYRKHPRVTSDERLLADKKLLALASRIIRLEIRANLVGATITLDGQEVGRTPLEVTSDPGRHVIELTSPGFSLKRAQVDLRAGQRQTVALVLQTLPAQLTVSTHPPQAEVRVGDQRIGKGRTATVPAGSHIVEAKLEGHRPVRRTVELAPGESLRLELFLPERVAELSVTADVGAARVAVDDVSLGEAPTLERRVRPGKRQIAVTHAGYDSWRGQVAINDGEAASVKVRLRRGRFSPRWFFIAGGVAVASLAGAAGLTVLARDQASHFSSLQSQLKNQLLPPSQIKAAQAQARVYAERSDSRWHQAIALYSVGGVAAAGAGVLALFTRWGRSDAQIVVGPATVGLRGGF